jgi:hypothetical protein
MTQQQEPVEQTQYSGRTRRYFLRAMRNGLIAGGGLLAWTGLVEPFWLDVSHQELAIPNLPRSWHGRRLVQISDWHAGKANRDYLERAIRVANSLEPDLAVITGDLIDCEHGLSDLDAILHQLKPARMGTFGCLGNHDYGHRFHDEDCAGEVIKLAADHGVQILRNEKTTLDGLDLFGMEDPWSPRFRHHSDILQREANVDRPAICLCHNPDVCDLDLWAEFRGVVLSGHTHGGQCKPPFLPAPMLPVLNRRYTQGFFELDARRQLYISRGIGYTMQVRFNCRPELTVFTTVPCKPSVQAG